jgi:Mycolic acid cyclopropane synthetase
MSFSSLFSTGGSSISRCSSVSRCPWLPWTYYEYNDSAARTLHRALGWYVLLWSGYQVVSCVSSCVSLSLGKKNESFRQYTSRWMSAWSSFCSETIGLPLIQYGFLPDALIRWGIRWQLSSHLAQLSSKNVTESLADKLALVQELSTMPVAIATDEANEQHYQVPTAFYDACLGPAKKYSSGYWPHKNTTFAESEVHMLQLYCDRAGVKDGLHIVDLGCGWGSLTLYLLEHYKVKVTAISNSTTQRAYILATAQERGYNMDNLTIVTVRCAVYTCGKGNETALDTCSLITYWCVSFFSATWRTIKGRWTWCETKISS